MYYQDREKSALTDNQEANTLLPQEIASLVCQNWFAKNAPPFHMMKSFVVHFLWPETLFMVGGKEGDRPGKKRKKVGESHGSIKNKSFGVESKGQHRHA